MIPILTLNLANRTLLPTDPRYALVIAAIIEIALLRSSHIIAVHTLKGLQSKWIPYELGRAKSRSIVSSQSGGWFEAGLAPGQFGSYVELAGSPGAAKATSPPGWPNGRPGLQACHGMAGRQRR
jgi:hypothetical protein